MANAVLHPIKTVEAIGNTALGTLENASNLTGATNFNDSASQTAGQVGQYFADRYGGSSPSEIVGNIGKTIYKDPVGAALDLSTLLAGIGGAVGKIGAISDATKAAEVAQASDYISTVNGLLKSSSPEAIKALTTDGTITKVANAVKTIGDYTNPITPISGAISGTAKGLANLTDSIPRRIVNNLLPQLKNSETIDYAINNTKLGTVDSMVSASEKALSSYDSQIQSILTHPDYADIKIAAQSVIDSTLKQFPNSEYTAEQIVSKMKTQLPGSSGLITKLQNGELTLEEANQLRQAVDKITYKTIIDSPEVRAGKDVAEAFGNALRNEVKTTAPETVPIFKNYSKEVNLKKALNKLSAKEAKKGAVSMKELLGALGASGLTGPMGGAITLGAEKLVNTPAVRVGAAKAIKSVSPVAQKTAELIGKNKPILKAAAVAGRVNQASQ